MKKVLGIQFGITSLLLLAGACAQPAAVVSPTTSPATTTTDPAICDNPSDVEAVSESVIGGLIKKNLIIVNVEGKPSACLKINNSYSNYIAASFYFKVEDKTGIHTFTASEAATFDVVLDTDHKKASVIFMDSVGFVQIAGTIDGSQMLNATIKYYNFPSQEDWFTSQMEAAKAACKAAADRAAAGKDPVKGQPTVANCLGYNQVVTNWWDLPSYSSEHDMLLAQAHQMLDSSDAKTVGTVQFDLSSIITN